MMNGTIESLLYPLAQNRENHLAPVLCILHFKSVASRNSNLSLDISGFKIPQTRLTLNMVDNFGKLQLHSKLVDRMRNDGH